MNMASVDDLWTRWSKKSVRLGEVQEKLERAMEKLAAANSKIRQLQNANDFLFEQNLALKRLGRQYRKNLRNVKSEYPDAEVMSDIYDECEIPSGCEDTEY